MNDDLSGDLSLEELIKQKMVPIVQELDRMFHQGQITAYQRRKLEIDLRLTSEFLKNTIISNEYDNLFREEMINMAIDDFRQRINQSLNEQPSGPKAIIRMFDRTRRCLFRLLDKKPHKSERK